MVYLVDISILRPIKSVMVVLCPNISGKGVPNLKTRELLHIGNKRCLRLTGHFCPGLFLFGVLVSKPVYFLVTKVR